MHCRCGFFCNATCSITIYRCATHIQTKVSSTVCSSVAVKNFIFLFVIKVSFHLVVCIGCRIKSSVYKLKLQLIESPTKVLSRLQELSHLLRSSKTLLALTTKLKNTKDVLKKAELNFKLNELIEDSGILNLYKVLTQINSRQKIRNLTQIHLITGLHVENQPPVKNIVKVRISKKLRREKFNLISFIS